MKGQEIHSSKCVHWGEGRKSFPTPDHRVYLTGSDDGEHFSLPALLFLSSSLHPSSSCPGPPGLFPTAQLALGRAGVPRILGLSATGRLRCLCFWVPLGFPSGASGDPTGVIFPSGLLCTSSHRVTFSPFPAKVIPRAAAEPWCALVSMWRSLLTASAFCSHQVCVD